jgi:hypothetical protein
VKRIIFLFLIVFVVTIPHARVLAQAFAQEEGDDFFDDEDEPFEDGAEDPGPRPSFPGQKGNTPAIQKPRPIESPRPAPQVHSVDDPVEFRLVDPPKYWKPKKRKHHRSPVPPTTDSKKSL